MRQDILAAPFWKVAARFSISFLLLLTIVLTGAQYFRYGNFDDFTAAIDNGSWMKFVAIRIALAIVYGVAMTYFSRKRSLKEQGNR